MSSAVLEFSAPHEIVPMLGLPTEKPARRELSSPVDGVLRSISALMNSLILGVIDTRTGQEFIEVLRTAYPGYVRLLRSFSEIVATMPPQLIVRVSIESLYELEDDLKAHGEESFGTEMTERALFTVFTLRKITPLLHLILTSQRKLEACDAEKDKDFAKNFLRHALIARFCVDCLIVAMDRKRTIYPEVLATLNDLMRSVVNAYAWVQQSADLRTDKQLVDTDAAFPPLDEEDQQLLNESMRDLSLDGI